MSQCKARVSDGQKDTVVKQDGIDICSSIGVEAHTDTIKRLNFT